MCVPGDWRDEVEGDDRSAILIGVTPGRGPAAAPLAVVLVAGWKDIGFAFGTTVGEVGKTGASEWGRGGGAEGSSSFLCYLPLFHSGQLPIPTV